MPISDAGILRLSTKPKPYKYSLGHGLYVHVFPNGGKYWRVKYRFAGRERTHSIGVFPEVSVTLAMEATKELHRMVRAGKDPAEEKRRVAKLRDKPVSKNLFRIELSVDGELTVETATKLLTLTQAQTKALGMFLAVQLGETEYPSC